MTEGDLDPFEWLCREYDGLRDELRQRAIQRSAVPTFLGAVVAVVSLLQKPNGVALQRLALAGIVVGIAVVVAGVSAWFANGRAMGRLSRRIVEIEAQLNVAIGKPVLQWETNLDSARSPFVHWLFGTGRRRLASQRRHKLF